MVTDSDFSEAIESKRIGGLIGGLKSRQVGAKSDSTESASPAKDPINVKQVKKEPQAAWGKFEVSGRGGNRTITYF